MATIFPHPIYIAWSPADSEIIFRTWKKGEKKKSVKSPFRGGLAVDPAATLTSLSHFFAQQKCIPRFKKIFFAPPRGISVWKNAGIYLVFRKPLVQKKSELFSGGMTQEMLPLKMHLKKFPVYCTFALRANHTHASAPFATVATQVGFVNRLQKVFF